MTARALRSHTPKGQRARAGILAAAEGLLAVRGFHGTSMRDVAAAARLPLATVVYHFARKERLYAAVLEEIGGELVRELLHGEAAVTASATVPTGATAPGSAAEAAQRLESFAGALGRWSLRNERRVRLLLRELLDNPARVARASKLPLAPIVTETAALIAAAGLAGAAPPELAVLHAVGAVHYVVAARPTVARIIGAARASQLAALSEREAIACARRALGLPREPVTAEYHTTQETRHASRPAALPRPTRPRAHRAAHDGPRTGAVDGAGGGVRRRGKARVRARPPVP